MMEGLAGNLAQKQAPQDSQMAAIEQIVQLLLEGADPEQLIQEGVPPEMIMQAIEMIEQQMAAQEGGQAQQAPAQNMGRGLAQSMMG